jgi:hypothetical protein
MANREVVRSLLRLRGRAQRPLDERLFLGFPGFLHRATAATTRLPLRSRLRRALLVQIARLVIEGQSRDDLELTVALYAPQSEVRNITTGGTAASILGLDDVYHGPEGVRRFFEKWAEPWEQWRWDEAGDVVDFGDGEALALLQLVGRGRGSGIEVREQVGLLIEIERGYIVRQRNWLGNDAWSEALKEVGAT